MCSSRCVWFQGRLNQGNVLGYASMLTQKLQEVSYMADKNQIVSMTTSHLLNLQLFKAFLIKKKLYTVIFSCNFNAFSLVEMNICFKFFFIDLHCTPTTFPAHSWYTYLDSHMPKYINTIPVRWVPARIQYAPITFPEHFPVIFSHADLQNLCKRCGFHLRTTMKFIYL